LFYAACALGHGNELQPIDFEAEQKTLLALPNNKRWREIEKRLQVTQCVRYASVEALRLVANSYKHDPRLQPDIELIRHLGLDEKLIYAAIPESFELKKGLARVVGLPDDSLFVDITQRFVEHVAEFLKDLQAKSVLSPVALGKVSLTDFAH
jgi:hypothetical protein